MNIHFIGIGGISMSALAEICLNKGYTVSGSDMNESYLLDKLRGQGANIHVGQCRENISNNIDMVVYTAAIHPENPELIAAKEKNILTMDRAAFLGQVMREYKNPIAVSGTHGKTSTTSMLSTIFEYANLDPTILVGGNLNIIGGNVKIGASDHFITEACEYVDSFLNFNPKISIVLNIEEDHLDYFSGLDEIKASFNKFGKLLPPDGYFIINGDDSNTNDILHEVKANVIKYGRNTSNDVIIKNINFNDNGYGVFELEYKGKDLGKFELSVPGLHNIYNATAAIMTAFVSDISLDTIRENITLYKGVGRRFETKGYYKDVLVIDDYAHHPTELKATLSAAKKLNKANLWCVFQPHTYTRTKSLLDSFAEAFYSADKVIITDIYAAREDDPGDIHAKDLVEKLYHNNVDAIYISKFEDIVEYLRENLEHNDLVITAGAGTVYQVADLLVEKK
ncbi:MULTISPECIES: UDP-N-acetylmuramate--L-alanine ligase [unclassified Romboutsia]|uniref:UDP-N-acetylmuramate--L-alanine ligase n=1 Tax=unclassified Romboutsia TaxID=2626894 RepID=UPI000820C3E4|nr:MULTISPECIES: UDP-N-acetylmuramate--L-alanine ligase [unclassified Romboutsia]SCI38753.1 UDP-N-acetylmuramate--L-alanine ligase [uncultured Clostridium sp.]